MSHIILNNVMKAVCRNYVNVETRYHDANLYFGLNSRRPGESLLLQLFASTVSSFEAKKIDKQGSFLKWE
jgi:hypothetical protein